MKRTYPDQDIMSSRIGSLLCPNGASHALRYTVAMTLGDRLQRARKAANMTQTDLADRASVRQSTISRYEQNDEKAAHSSEVLSQLAAALGVTLEYLITGQDPTPATPQNAYERACAAFVLLAPDPVAARAYIVTQTNRISETDEFTAAQYLTALQVQFAQRDQIPEGITYRAPRSDPPINSARKRKGIR